MPQNALTRPKPSSQQASDRLRAARQRDTSPEVLLRSALHRAGVRFQVGVVADKRIKTRPDIVLRSKKIAVFVDGCFWHSCPKHATIPRSNRAWWVDKLRKNRERDRRNRCCLKKLGWRIVSVWEHESVSAATRRILRLMQLEV
ncbi:MAG: DNA mismatch endonuclease Vsr [Acidobacteria bacterium]|nr:DNA mismatch endonuclease Vsr [Acidobacteriota bacterium]